MVNIGFEKANFAVGDAILIRQKSESGGIDSEGTGFIGAGGVGNPNEFVGSGIQIEEE